MTDPNPNDTPGDLPPEPADAVDPAEVDAEPFDDEAETLDDETAPLDEDADEQVEAADEAQEAEAAAVAAGTPAARRARAADVTTARTPTPSEVAVHVDDRISAAFVVLVAIVFAAILLWGLLLGHGGFLNPVRTPTPAPSVSASPSASASGSPGASASESPSPSVSTSASPSGS